MTILPPKGQRAVPITAMFVLICVITLLVWPILPVGGPFGKADARRDMANGQIKIYASVSDFGWQKEWKERVKEKYGIEIGGRMRSSIRGGYLSSYDAAYNAEQRAGILKRFGRDVVHDEMFLASENR